jgi:hypothetical protein
MHEAMARYQAHYGLAPIGPHRGMADALFRDTTVPCEPCRGRGIVASPHDPGWAVCPPCRGLGTIFTVSAREIEARRQQVLARFPGAAADPVDPWRGWLAHDLARGCIVTLPPDPEEAEQSDSGEPHDRGEA